MTESFRRRRILNSPDGTVATCFADSVAAVHPPILPEPPFSGPAPHCWRAPSILASTEDLLIYRDSCLSLVHWGGFYRDAVAAVDAALNWRASAPEHCRFWPEDSGYSLVASRDGVVIGGQWVPGDDEAWARVCADDLAYAQGCSVAVFRNGKNVWNHGTNEEERS
ncbi:MAG TPA: hypothetical protein VK196_03360 [Magnetospirillum sp.]|nr:hypothetical protein [Magnetospirillum sp.]